MTVTIVELEVEGILTLLR